MAGWVSNSRLFYAIQQITTKSVTISRLVWQFYYERRKPGYDRVRTESLYSAGFMWLNDRGTEI